MRPPASHGRRLSVEEYLEREQRSDRRHEYVDGYVYAMTGARVGHMKIGGNVYRALHAAAAGGPCNLFMNDAMVRVSDVRYYYPDIIAICTPVDDDDVILSGPCLVVEVTSPSTRGTDRREKLVEYGKVPSIETYLIVDHRRRFVEWYVRDGDGLRLRAGVAGDGALELPCPRTTLTLDTIYEGLTLPTVRERGAGYRSGPA